MKPATVAAAALVIGAALYATRRQLEPAAAALDPDTQPDWIDEAEALVYEARNALLPSPVATMQPSQDLLAMLREGEALRLQRYRLGDGGWTIGYGRYYPDSGAPPPERITLATAEAWFAVDVEQRGARWVRAYVRAPLLQHQFDALVHMAFNLKPSSFKTIADAVNDGNDPEAAALVFIRPGSNLEHGLRNRRAREVALYRQGTYA